MNRKSLPQYGAAIREMFYLYVNRSIYACKKGLLLFLCTLFFSGYSFAQGTWTPLTNLAPHNAGGGARLLSDGTVIVKTDTGGGDTYGNIWDRLTPDSHGSYVNGTWSSIAPMHNTRTYFASQMLKDGRIYVAGGEFGTGLSTWEVYNPVTDTWTMGPVLNAMDRISDGVSEILPDGKVLQNLYQGECMCVNNGNLLYDPVTNTYDTATRSIGIQTEGAWVTLPDGSILTVDMFTKNSERYIPSLHTWVVDDTLPYVLSSSDEELGAAVLLPDGRAMFFGATGLTAYYTPSGSASPGTWAAGPAMPDCWFYPTHIWSAKDAPAAMMADGKILCALTPYYPSGMGGPTAFFEFDYLTGTFTRLLAPNGDSTLPDYSGTYQMLDLPDGSVLTTIRGSSQYYVYTPTGTPLTAGKPIIDSIIKVSCDTYLITGKLFNGITEGAEFGDDWQMNTNYPIVRLTSTGGVYYARSFNWNRTGVMTGTLPDTATVVLPASLPDAWYGLQVIANGNPSSSHPFTICGSVLSASQPLKENYSINIYPNPAHTQASIVFNSREGGMYTIKVLDVLGQAVIATQITTSAGSNRYTADISNLPKGVYTVLIQGSDQNYNARLVVE